MRLPSELNLAELEAALRSRTGFDLQSVGDRSLLRGLCQRMTDKNLSDGDGYVAQLLKDEAEFEEFVEDLVIPETWFFRDRQPFRCIQHYATQCWRPSGLGDCLRILSIPCSTGEEPYSIAMALLEAGLLPSAFQIDAADLSRRSLRRAAEATYGKSSFRGDEAAFPGLCDRFLERHGDHYMIGAPLQGTVRFFQANLLSPSLLEGRSEYHIVLCRNVLIYLDANARRVALANLHRMLAPEGFLYVGHVEARVAAEGAFCRFSAEFPFAFSPTVQGSRPEATSGAARIACSSGSSRAKADCRRTTTVTSTGGNSLTATRPNRALPGRAPSVLAGSHSQVASPSMPVEAASEGPSVSEMLATCRGAADEGRLEEAAGLCNKVLTKDPTNVEAFCLLGLLSKVRGEAVEAERFLQKALYLDPRHAETLVHMMMLAQQRGDERAAANFRRRAEQAQKLRG